jgi:hypothetical protein
MKDEKESTDAPTPDPGIFITQGMQISVPSFEIRIKDDGSIDVEPITLHTGLDLCPYWLEIGIIHLDKSVASHTALMEAKENSDDQAIGAALQDEFQSGMQTIMASAVAIDAYYANIKDRIELPEDIIISWKKNGTARYKQITEVFRRAFKIPKKQSENLRATLKEIFRFRDMAVHPSSGTTAPALHPELNKVSDWRFAFFRNYNAKLALKLAISVIDQTSRQGNSEIETVNSYCSELQSRLVPICEQWEGSYGELYE